MHQVCILWFVVLVILGQVSLTSSISGRNACPSELVILTCTAQGTAVHWGSEAFREKTMHYTRPPYTGEFRAEIVSYDGNQNCLVSSLSFRATDLRNGTTVTCKDRNKSSSQSFSLHIIGECSHMLTHIWYACMEQRKFWSGQDGLSDFIGHYAKKPACTTGAFPS